MDNMYIHSQDMILLLYLIPFYSMTWQVKQCLKTWINKWFQWTWTHSSVVSTDPPILDPVFQDVRSRNYQMVTLRCTVLRSNPPRLTDIRWFRNGDIIRMPMPDLKETPELKFKLEPTNNGSYECRVSNSAGTSTCTFNVSGEWTDMRPCFVIHLWKNIYLSIIHPSIHFIFIFNMGSLSLSQPSDSTTLQCWVLLRHTQSSPNPKRKQLFLQPAVDTERSWGHRPDHRLLG